MCSSFEAKCFSGTGASYRGTQTFTVNEQACRNWMEVPSMHTHNTTWYQQHGIGNHSYCRNPEGAKGAPWCYVQDTTGSMAWEYCEPVDCFGLSNDVLCTISA